MSIFKQAQNNDLEAIKSQLILDFKDQNQKTLLHYAVLGRAYDVIHFLIGTGMDINQTDITGESALFDAARKDKLQIAKILLQKHAKVNIINNKGETVLHLASQKGNIEFVKLLVEQGAILDLKTKEDKLAMHYAIMGGHIDVFEYLRNLSRVSFNYTDKYKNTFLHHATKTLNEHMVKHFIEQKVNVNALNDQFETPLFNAVKFSKEQIIMQLILNQAFIQIKNRRYETPIDIAKIFEKNDIYELLVRQSQMPQYQRFVKKYALTKAVLNRDFQELKRLLSLFTPAYKDQYQMTPLDYANAYKFSLMVEYLKLNHL